MTFTQAEIGAILAEHLSIFRLPGVLSVRPGYELRDGWLTGTPAIVVTVGRRQLHSDALPASVDGVPVDVRPASEAKRAQLRDPVAYARRWGPYPDRGAVPEFATELNLARRRRTHPVPHIATPTKPNLPYSPPTNIILEPVTGPITLQLSASPDSGWPTLGPFLAGTQTSLTVGLYDFTSAHILDAVKAALPGRKVDLVLDHPAKNPTADQTDEETVAALKTALGADLAQAWALERMDPLAAAWIFPTAYHIKVAVRDSREVWLSSGNWNNSNQPDIDPVSRPGDAAAARSGDRDWHVIIQNEQLAGTFEAFLHNDLAIALQHDRPTPALDLQGEVALPNVQTPPFATFFPAQTVSGPMRITPLLTPDPGVYIDAVTALIAGARKSLYLQFQYIELPKTASTASQPFAALVQTVIGRQQAGVEVKIIMSEYETAGYLEQLQAAGLDVVNVVRIQNNVHNKGIVVDGSVVLVSSQNWSTDGTLFNRDAGVIIENADAAGYFQRIFLHDWNHLAQQKVTND